MALQLMTPATLGGLTSAQDLEDPPSTGLIALD
jgi:hypothetical protein